MSGVSPVPVEGFCVFVMAGASPAVGLVVSEEKPSLVCPMNGFFSYPVGGCCELCMPSELVL